jgi:hypothetical protein
MGANMWEEGSDAVKDAHQVDIKHPAPVIERDVVDAASTRNASIVANQMDIPECRKSYFCGVFDTIGIGNVACHTFHGWADAAKVFDSGRQCVILDIGKHHLHACLRKGSAEGKANAAGATCHEGCFAREFPHVPELQILLIRV